MSAATSVTREYLETIYNLTVEGDPVVGARLAEKFGVSQPNVAQVLSRMQENGLIRMPGRGRGRQGDGIELTEEGRSQAEDFLRQHRLAERFLTDILGMDWVEAHEEAHHMELGMSQAIEDHLTKLLNNPRTCPHGNPIPSKTLNTVNYLREQHAVRLSAAKTGVAMKVVLISEVVEDETALLRFLGQIEIMPGARLTILNWTDGDKTLSVRVVPRPASLAAPDAPEELEKKAQVVTLTSELASKIWVRRFAV